jgi:uncharacterized membrane protein YeaQ/YmgE (transglycosylase-associated protein family)
MFEGRLRKTTMLQILIVILIGWIVGMCAELLLPGTAPRSFVGTTLVGVGGAILGSLVGRQFGWWHKGQAPGFVLSLLGAIVLLALWRVFRRRRAA